MSEGAFWFVLSILAAIFVLTSINWVWSKLYQKDDIAKEDHERLMREIRRHKDN